MQALERVRETTQKALEEFRAQKNKTIDAHVWLTLPMAEHLVAVKHEASLADYLVVARVDLQVGDERRTLVRRAEAERCPRCWKRIVTREGEPCPRCAAALAARGRAG